MASVEVTRDEGAPPEGAPGRGAVLGGRYRLEERLANGGSSFIYRAVDLTLGRSVAVKCMRGRLWESRQRSRFLEEARTLATLRHPHLITVYDAGEDDVGGPFLVMELLEGRTLGAAMVEPMAPERTLAWIVPVLGALATAHDHAVFHRDISPSNVFLEARPGGVESPVLIDFGIAQRGEPSGHTTPHTVLGTPAYMAPEYLVGEPFVAASDVWSMGVLLFQALSGRLPFERGNTLAALSEMVHGTPPSLTDCAPEVPLPLGLAVDRALRPADQRYPDVRRLAHALAEGAVAGGIPVPVAPDPVGLPHWDTWVAEARSDGGTARIGVIDGDASSPLQVVPSGSLEAGAPSTSVSGVSAWKRWWVAAAAVAALGAAAYALAAGGPGEDAAETSGETTAGSRVEPTEGKRDGPTARGLGEQGPVADVEEQDQTMEREGQTRPVEAGRSSTSEAERTTSQEAPEVPRRRRAESRRSQAERAGADSARKKPSTASTAVSTERDDGDSQGAARERTGDDTSAGGVPDIVTSWDL
ncbi:MAG: protein kinase domain-containing protein [Myxococcota bacterium]